MQNQLFDLQYIDLNLNVCDKFEAISYLANLASDRLVDVDKYIEDVKKREATSTTGIGDNVAIPHAKSTFVKIPTVIVGRSKKGIEWKSLDDKDVNIIFLIAVPDNESNEHLKIIQTLSISLVDDDFRENILTLDNKVEVLNLLLEKTNN